MGLHKVAHAPPPEHGCLEKISVTEKFSKLTIISIPPCQAHQGEYFRFLDHNQKVTGVSQIETRTVQFWLKLLDLDTTEIATNNVAHLRTKQEGRERYMFQVTACPEMAGIVADDGGSSTQFSPQNRQHYGGFLPKI